MLLIASHKRGGISDARLVGGVLRQGLVVFVATEESLVSFYFLGVLPHDGLDAVPLLRRSRSPTDVVRTFLAQIYVNGRILLQFLGLPNFVNALFVDAVIVEQVAIFRFYIKGGPALLGGSWPEHISFLNQDLPRRLNLGFSKCQIVLGVLLDMEPVLDRY